MAGDWRVSIDKLSTGALTWLSLEPANSSVQHIVNWLMQVC